jgi:hypothetical protein
MGTTIRLSPELLTEAKRYAAQSRATLTAVIEDSLRATLSRRPPARKANALSLPTYGGSGVLPGVDLTSSASLLALMEGEGDPR